MASGPISQKTMNSLKLMEPFLRFFQHSTWARRRGEPDVCDFTLGNPHDMPVPGFVDALQRWVAPRDADWYAYKMNEPASCATVAASLRAQRGLPFEPEDIFLTNGAFGAICVALATVADPGDEVIFVSPPWPLYETLIAAAGATPVRVRIAPGSFDLDLDAIDAAITVRTRGIIVNSPHNPTGKIYPPETLEALAGMLTAASDRLGRTIYLLSDEAYSRIVFDGRSYHSPTAFYPSSFLLYTYGKTLLTPGQRIGYIALPPSMPDREPLRTAILAAQFASSYAFPNALLQHALPDLEQLSIDIAHLERKRDRLVGALRGMGCQLHSPEGTFYLLPRSPWPDDWAFVELLAESDVFCLPGATLESPGYFRISMTASDEMIERAIPRFEAAIKKATRQKRAA